jgi:P-type Cu2+ transporter
MREFELSIGGMTCSVCSNAVRRALMQCPSITAARVEFLFNRATVTTGDITDEALKQKLQQAVNDQGFTCSEIRETNNKLTNEERAAQEKIYRQKQKRKIYTYLTKGIVGILSGAVMLVTCMTGILPHSVMPLIAGISTLLTLYLGKETYQHASTQCFQGNPFASMDSLFTVSTLLALGASCAAFFFPWLPMMFEAPLLIFGCKYIGEAIKESVKKPPSNTSFQDDVPATVMRYMRNDAEENLLDQTQYEESNIGTIKLNDIIYIAPGQTIPLDGTCLSQHATIDTRIKTGKIENIVQGDKVLAGYTIPDHAEGVLIKVKRLQNNSALMQCDEKIKAIKDSKKPLQTAIPRVLQYFIPAVFVIATLSAITMGFLVSSMAAIQCAISVLVAACPCAMGLIAPLAINSGAGKAKKNGITFKDGDCMEAAAEIDTVVFDLNGTLTTGEPKVVKIVLNPNLSPERSNQILHAIQTIEAHSAHPIGKAIVESLANVKCHSSMLSNVKVTQIDRLGITAMLDEQPLMIGNGKFMKNQKIL